ncbi:hypothetical protein C0J52_14479 [Blattella germanica]|nr:hypothetical protein C0J52_14479 [Blattella germanica]
MILKKNLKMEKELHNGSPLIKNRFSLYLVYLRIAGIPIFMKEKSKLYFAYELIVNVCVYGTLMACCIQLLEFKHDLKVMMTTLRVAMSIVLGTLVHFYIRIHTLKFEELIQLTNDFTWEELPTRSPTTGNLTAAGWIDIIRKVIKFTVNCILIFHTIQSLYRICTQGSLVFYAWYPFDYTVSPAYELTNLSQNWGDYADMAQSFVIYTVLMATIFTICWPANELSVAAENVKLAAYEGCWIGAPISFQKSILLMITRTNQPFFLTAGKFVPVNNATMMNILNESLSLFMFLLQMKVKHDEQN